MQDSFEIFGTLIKYDDIKDFRVVQKEYIYRPTYKESAKKLFGSVKYEFAGMKPYAAIKDEKGRKSSTSSHKPLDIKESIGKDVFEDVRTTIGDRFNIKAIRAKKYTCVNQTGREFTTYLEDIPALLVRGDGKFSDVMKHDELYRFLGEPIAPAVNIIPALVIKAKEDFIFYGSGIQIEDVGNEFQRLKQELEIYKEWKDEQKSQKKLVNKLPIFKLSGKKQAQLEDKGSADELVKLKKALDDNILTKEEYDAKVAEVIDKL